MTERKLASIQRITSINPIEGADKIEVASVLGWNVVVAKEVGHKVNDLVVFCEIDSLLPERPEFEFLRDRCYVKESNSVNGAGFRLKTIRLRKQVSQGLIMPVAHKYDDNAVAIHTIDDSVRVVHEGDDVTEFLGVKKYEKPVPANLVGKARGNFPPFIPKTDAERIQNCFRTFEREWKDHIFEATVKLDGTSFTAYYRRHPDLIEGQFGVCSRNLDLVETEGNVYWEIARKYALEEKLKKLPFSAAIQGEIIGPGIQGNKEKVSENMLFVFNIYNIDEGRYLTDAERYGIIMNQPTLNNAPVLGTYESSEFTSVQDFLDFANGPSYNPDVKREGVVMKSINDPSIQFKCISNEWLIEYGE